MSRAVGAGQHSAWLATWLVVFMWFAYFLNYCDRQAVFAMFPALKSDLHFTDSQLGLIGSAFLWVYGIGCPLAGWVADRYSKRLLVVGSLVIWSLVTIATGFVGSVLAMLALRAAMGVSESLYMPAAVSLTANAHPASQRSRAVATLTTAQIAGTVAGGWFGGWMADQGWWRQAFFVLGCVGILYALPYFAFLRRFRETSVEALATEAHAAEQAPVGTSHVRKKDASGRQLFQVPSYAMLCIAFPVFVFGLWMLYAWLPAFLYEKFELDMARAGFVSTIYLQSAMLVGLLAGGVLADKLFLITTSARFWLLVLSLVSCAPCLHMIGNSDSLLMTCVGAVGFGLVGGFFAGNIFPAAFEVVPAARRASAVGWLNFFGSALSGFAPLMGGVWRRSIGIELLLSYTGMAYVVAAAALACGIAWFFRKDYAAVH